MKPSTGSARRALKYLYVGLAFLLWENAISAFLGDYHFEIRRTFGGIVFYGGLFLVLGACNELLNALYARLHPAYQWAGQKFVWFLAVLATFLLGPIVVHILGRFGNVGTAVLNLTNFSWIVFGAVIGWGANMTLARIYGHDPLPKKSNLLAFFLAAILFLILSTKIGHYYFYSDFLAIGYLLLLPPLAVFSFLIGWLAVQSARSAFALRSVLALCPMVLSLPAVIASGYVDLQRPTQSPLAPLIQQPPNVIIMLFDALRADHVGAIAPDVKLTPNMDALARQGRVYDNCISTSSWTAPATLSLMTSRNASLLEFAPYHALPDSAVTLPQMLHDHGYYAAGISTNPNASGVFGLNRGFDEFLLLQGRGPRQLFTPDECFMLPRKKLLRELAYQFGFINTNVAAADWRRVNEAAAAQIARAGGRPLFLYLHYLEPHAPYVAEPFHGGILDWNALKLMGKGFKRPMSAQGMPTDISSIETEQIMHTQHERYEEGVQEADKAVGDLEKTLMEKGLDKNTIIFIMSDHGEEFGEHGGWGHMTTLYQEEVRMPLIISAPGMPELALPEQPEGVSILDVAPTILDLAGLEIPNEFEGLSLLQPSPGKRTFHLALLADKDFWSAVMTFPNKVILHWNYSAGNVDTMLFNLELDHQESTNLYYRLTKFAESMASQADLEAPPLHDPMKTKEPKLSRQERQNLKALGYLR